MEATFNFLLFTSFYQKEQHELSLSIFTLTNTQLAIMSSMAPTELSVILMLRDAVMGAHLLNGTQAIESSSFSLNQGYLAEY